MNINPNQFESFEIPYNKVLARIGFAHGKTKLDNNAKQSINEALELAIKLITPKQVISSSKISLINNAIIALEPGLEIISSKIYELLKDCSTAYGFAVTIGPGLEEKRNKYINEKEPSRALILDAIGSVIAEELAEITNKQINNEHKKNKMTKRFSPGYGDWALSGQKDFLLWLGAEQIGIKLNPNFQMLPEKSVSAILGMK
ncbi:MAG: hypothetical protein LHV68_04975 [Elusimicrobia bacterium]|nr:hypothetical protein [Candidatus Liberimonas magnetica]